MGVKYMLASTNPSRHSPGRTHLWIYDRLNREWTVDCTSRRYTCIEQDTPALQSECCTKCAPMIERVFGITDDTCPECHNQFEGKMPGHAYGSNWDWVPCQTCHGTGKDPAHTTYERTAR